MKQEVAKLIIGKNTPVRWCRQADLLLLTLLRAITYGRRVNAACTPPDGVAPDERVGDETAKMMRT
jgi:hypothetical protein